MVLITFILESRTLVPDRTLLKLRDTEITSACRAVSIKLLMYRLKFSGELTQIFCSSEFDLCAYRTSEEAAIGHMLAALFRRVPAWRGVADYHQSVIL